MKRIFLFIVAILLVLPASVSFGAAFSANEQVTNTKLNTLNNANINSSAAIDPEKIDDHSATTTEQDTTSDPYAGDAQTLATDLSVELRQLRFVTEEIKQAFPAAALTEKWYNSIPLGSQGEIPYWNATRFTKLGVGTSGQFLKTQGASANPVWAASPQVYLGTATRDVSSASGTQVITGVGFTPKALIIMGVANASAANNSWGLGTGAGAGSFGWDPAAAVYRLGAPGDVIVAFVSSTAYNVATVALDSDGFTLTWTKTGSPTGTITFKYLALG